MPSSVDEVSSFAQGGTHGTWGERLLVKMCRVDHRDVDWDRKVA